jgi:hypothetical protein
MNMGKFTYEQEIGPDSTKLHHPTPTSGVTIGAGYDMKEKSQDTILEDMTSVDVPQNTSERISLASGLTGKEATNFVQENSDIEITPDQQEKLFTISMSDAFKRADNDLQSMGYDPANVSEDKKELLADYAYNIGGLLNFPKFTNALVNNDFDTAKKESQRFSGKQPLTRRNEATLAKIDEIAQGVG